MRERVDVQLVNGFIKSKLGVTYKDSPKRYKTVAQTFDGEHQQIKAFRELWNPKTQRFETLFYLPKHGLGRLQPKGHVSAVCLPPTHSTQFLHSGVRRS